MRASILTTIPFLLLLITGCTFDNTIPEESLPERVEWELVKNNTVKISDNIGYFSNSLEGMHIGVTKDRQSVFLYNSDNGDFNTVSIAGEGPDKTGEIFQAAMLNKETFLVMDITYAYTYNLEGTQLSKCGPLIDRVNYDRYSLPIVISEKEIMTTALSPYIEINSPDYFDNNSNFFYAKVNLETCEVITGGELSPDNIYRKDFFAVRMRPKIVQVTESTFVSNFPFNKEIDVISSKDFTIEKTIKLNPENFGVLSTATGSYIEDQVNIIQSNSAYRHLLPSSSTGLIMTQYKTGMDKIIPADELMAQGDNSKIGGKKYLELYNIESGAKLGKDLLFNKSLIPLSFIDLNNVNFYSTSFEDQEGMFLHSYKVNIKEKIKAELQK
ncbi:MAG: hypothetical protein AB8H12_24255 [Lewinella sp.]